MKMSVIIAAYQAAKVIERCLDSIVYQNLDGVEVIIINDGSTDETQNMIEKYKLHFNHIISVTQDNKGISESKKLGLELASGEYILFVDSDDVLAQGALATLYHIAMRTKVDIIIYNAKHVLEGGEKVIYTFPQELRGEVTVDPLSLCLNNQIHAPLWCKCIRRLYLLEQSVRFPKNISYCEDTVTTISLFLHQPNIYYCEEVLYDCIDRQDSHTHQALVSVKDFKESIIFLSEELKSHQKFEDYKLLIYKTVILILNWGIALAYPNPYLIDELIEFLTCWKAENDIEIISTH